MGIVVCVFTCGTCGTCDTCDTLSLYHDLILDHYRNSRNFGTLEYPDVVIRETNASCGDEIEVQLQIERMTTNDARITNVKWTGRGCVISMAAASLLSEQISQIRQIRQIRQISERDVVAFLGGEISSGRMRCATLALVALQKALARYE